ncbi:MAG: HDOD domain-containing protein [Pseudomonadales bacterium]|jgi:HD-like signal output (HDOD) protein|nr:HDOD domain-containing protein [Pseudomonadales bacterium]
MAEQVGGSLAALIQRRVEADSFRLPVFNPVALKVMQSLREQADMSQVERLICKDPGLAAEVLRVANSALFSGLSASADLKQALVRLGSAQVTNVVMLAAQEQAFQAGSPMLESRMKRLWLHSMISAMAGRWIADKAGLRDEREHAFLAGLLHDVGSLVIVRVMDELIRDGQATDVTDQLLDELIDSLHTNFGYQVLVAWELPQMYADVTRDHEQDARRSAPPLLAVIRLVDAACRLLGVGQPADPDVVLEDLPETQRLGLKPVVLAELEIFIEDTAHKAGCKDVGRVDGAIGA